MEISYVIKCFCKGRIIKSPFFKKFKINKRIDEFSF